MTRILILGASGMLGNACLRFFDSSEGFQVLGTVRSERSAKLLPESLRESLLVGIDVLNTDHMTRAIEEARPDVVMNCIGLVKQLAHAKDPLEALPVNALFPHRLARLCSVVGARTIHMSTDCVFSGSKGMYREEDFADADDIYGRSKFLGEVDYPNAVTLRTSIIGHELEGGRSLIDWFLSQKGSVKGFTEAIFSGLPTVEIARVVRDHVISDCGMHGVYHLSAGPIDKFSLLKLVANAYGKDIEIEPSQDLNIDRSLDSSRFRERTGFSPKPWPQLVEAMRDFR